MSRFFTALVMVMASFCSFAENNAWLALEKAAYAARELNYEGQFVYQNGKQSRTVEIRHMFHSGREFTRSMVLGNAPREVLAEGNDIVIFQKNNNGVKIAKRRGQNLFPAMLPINLKLLRSSYNAKIGALDYVAGRRAQIIDLNPKDAFRYNYRIWTDVEFGLLVKMTLLNDQEETLEQVYFNRLSMLNTKDLNWFKPKMDVSKNYEVEDATKATHVNEDWIIVDLPSGYRQIDHIKRKIPGGDAQMNQLIFSDGIASVSLFIEPLVKGKPPRKGDMVKGSTHVCANVIEDYQVIVVGEVPAKTVKKIAEAVRFKKHNDAD